MRKVTGNFEADTTLKNKYCVLVTLKGELQEHMSAAYDERYYMEMELTAAYQGLMNNEMIFWDRDTEGKQEPDVEEVASWNEMIDSYSCYGLEWDDDGNDWNMDEAWILTEAELDEIGWKKI